VEGGEPSDSLRNRRLSERGVRAGGSQTKKKRFIYQRELVRAVGEVEKSGEKKKNWSRL